MSELEQGLDLGQTPRRRALAFVGVLCGAFVGGAAVGIMVLMLILTFILTLFVIATIGWGLWAAQPLVDHWLLVCTLGGLAGGVTGVVVAVLAKTARHFGIGAND